MLVVRGGTHNKQQLLGDGADGNNNSNNTPIDNTFIILHFINFGFWISYFTYLEPAYLLTWNRLLVGVILIFDEILNNTLQSMIAGVVTPRFALALGR